MKSVTPAAMESLQPAKMDVIQRYRNYGNVKSGEIASLAPITRQHDIRDAHSAPPPTSHVTAPGTGFTRPRSTVRVMSKD